MPRYGRSRKISGLALLFGGVVVLVIIFFRPLSQFLKAIATPLWRTRQTTEEEIQVALKSKKALYEELAAVGQELTEARLKIIELATVEEENRELKQLLGRAESQNLALAGILTYPNQSLYNSFQIDAGAEQGIAVGARVFVGTSTVVGTVTSVTETSSTVTSLASPGEQTSAYVAGSDIVITVTGRGGGDFEVELPRDIPFETGMAIVSQGIDSHTIAIIERIISDPRDPFQQLLARMPVNLRTVKWVMVEKK